MLHLPASLAAWGTPAFAATLKRELADRAASLPLQQAVTTSSSALDSGIEAMLITVQEDDRRILARVGVFFSGIVAGCSCADDPTPVAPQPEYCELQLAIDRTTAATDVTLLADD